MSHLPVTLCRYLAYTLPKPSHKITPQKITCVLALGVGIVVSVSLSLGLFEGLEHFFEDLLVSTKPVGSEIVILAVDDASLRDIGQWPWPREVFAKALTALNKYPPKTVGVDVIFSEPSARGERDDAALQAALANLSYPVVLPTEAVAMQITDDQLARTHDFLKPLSIFTDTNYVTLGHVNVVLDRDGIVRKFPSYIAAANPEQQKPIAAFAWELLKRANYLVPHEEHLNAVLPIVYAVPTGSVRSISFSRLINENEATARMLQGKIVLIGVTAPDLHDLKLTPFSRGQEMPGVELQAQIVNMLAKGYRLAPLDARLQYPWILLSSLGPVLFFMLWRRSLKPLFASITFGVAQMAIIVALFEQGVAVNMLHAHAAWILSVSSLFGYRYFIGEREQREIKKLFGKYVSPRVLDEILKNPAQVRLGGEEKEVTVLFSDIRGFTTMSEKMSATELVRVLNKYFSRMSGEIIRREGVLDKYIGDAIMAFWGAPFADPAQADHALEAAEAMIRELAVLNKELRDAGDPEIAIGIGLHTGPAVVGNIGSEFRFDYTLIGDTVNVASRLEGLNKEHKTTLILSQSTKDMLTGDGKFRSLGKVMVKGREESLQVYTLG